MVLKLTLIFQALAITFKSTQLFLFVVVVLKIFRVYVITPSAAVLIPQVSATAVRDVPSTAPNGLRNNTDL